MFSKWNRSSTSILERTCLKSATNSWHSKTSLLAKDCVLAKRAVKIRPKTSFLKIPPKKAYPFYYPAVKIATEVCTLYAMRECFKIVNYSMKLDNILF